MTHFDLSTPPRPADRIQASTDTAESPDMTAISCTHELIQRGLEEGDYTLDELCTYIAQHDGAQYKPHWKTKIGQWIQHPSDRRISKRLLEVIHSVQPALQQWIQQQEKVRQQRQSKSTALPPVALPCSSSSTNNSTTTTLVFPDGHVSTSAPDCALSTSTSPSRKRQRVISGSSITTLRSPAVCIDQSVANTTELDRLIGWHTQLQEQEAVLQHQRMILDERANRVETEKQNNAQLQQVVTHQEHAIELCKMDWARQWHEIEQHKLELQQKSREIEQHKMQLAQQSNEIVQSHLLLRQQEETMHKQREQNEQAKKAQLRQSQALQNEENALNQLRAQNRQRAEAQALLGQQQLTGIALQELQTQLDARDIEDWVAHDPLQSVETHVEVVFLNSSPSFFDQFAPLFLQRNGYQRLWRWYAISPTDTLYKTLMRACARLLHTCPLQMGEQVWPAVLIPTPGDTAVAATTSTTTTI